MMKNVFLLLFLFITLTCRAQEAPLTIYPDIITESTPYDTDDPAIWVDLKNPSKSIIFGTDKNTDGAIFAFDLYGRIIEQKTIYNCERPNNVDIEYGFRLPDGSETDILVFTEREKQQVRVFSVPDMQPLDEGGFSVFENETDQKFRLPMGIGLFKSPKNKAVYIIVSRKYGPSSNYLYQYLLTSKDDSSTQMSLVREFGKFSGKKEIESIAIDDELGFVYYGDEGVCIRKYYAEPAMGDEELSCFGGEHFLADIEGIAIAKTADNKGYLIASDQQNGSFSIFSRADNSFVKSIRLATIETDGCEVVTIPLNTTFPKGLFVAMNKEKNFYMYDWGKFQL